MTRRVVVDTNVAVAGLISSHGDSPVCRLLDGMLAESFLFLLSTELLREYRSVLLRDALRELHGLSPTQVDVVLTEIAANALVREPETAPDLVAPDRDDDHLWRLLSTTPGSMLVTGERTLLANPPDSASVHSPRTFIDSMAGEQT